MSHPITQPLRPLTDAERSELARVSHASSERLNRHQRAVALLAVEAGKSLTDAAKAAGWKAQKTVARLIRRFNEASLSALDDLPRSGHPRSYGPTERARIIQELRRSPLRKEDGTATWSLSTLQRTLREAPDGLPQVSTFTLLYTIHEAGYSWQKSRTWCETGKTLRKPAADQLDRFFPPVRMLLIWDNLAGHKSHSLVQWCAEHGILLLSTPSAGSWLNMAESMQRIIKRRALQGQHTYDVEILKQWLTDAVVGWNRHPTPFIWGGKRHARRDRAYARRHRMGGSGATTAYVMPRRIRSVRYYKKGA